MTSDPASDVTHLLVAWRGGDDQALAELMPLVYGRLKEIAARLLHRERRDHTFDTAALVNEAYLRLVDLERIGWRDRVHFFAMCARIMRRVLIDHARHHARAKRGGDAIRVSTGALYDQGQERAAELLALDQALCDLAAEDAERATIVELRFFGGLDREEIAEALSISTATVTRRWLSARAWLARYLSQEPA